MNISYCKKCLFPETKPDLSFNQNGVCSACIAAEEKDKGVDWEKRKKDFFDLMLNNGLKNIKALYDKLKYKKTPKALKFKQTIDNLTEYTACKCVISIKQSISLCIFY